MSTHCSMENTATHLFMWTTNDGYVSGGYNLYSGVFNQVSTQYTPGMTLKASASGAKPPSEVTVSWQAYAVGDSPAGGDGQWWLYVNGVGVGYVDNGWFLNGMGGNAPLAQDLLIQGTFFFGQAGGEVCDGTLPVTGLPTTTQMGDGQFAAGGYPKAAYQRNVNYSYTFDGANETADVPTSASQTDPTLYTANTTLPAGGTGWGSYFYFGGPGYVAPTKPAAPTGVTATASAGKITVKWTAVTGATGYAVACGTKSGGPYSTVASNLTTTSYVDSAVKKGTTYYCVVNALNAAGTSPNSKQVSAKP